MAKHKVVAARTLQIVGHDGDVEGGTLLATIETDCEIGSLVSALHFGSARVETEEAEANADADASKASPKRTRAKGTSAPAGDAGTKSNSTTRRR